MCQSSAESFVHEMAKRGYYEGVRRLSNDLDAELMTIVTKPSPTARYLSFQRAKSRPARIDSYKYFPVPPVS